ncbi:heterogeneous nuclear ribonucleoprotein L-like [Convolutriloba macropyga]|uniref:heterogeneous nuclear ribonucleoprotein L-like n=1 Tax=Convolutriloba macropyga TaxID=536237 RepID=UPI003F521492
MYHGGMDGSSMYRGGASPQTAMLPGGGVVPADIMPACFLMYGMNEEKFGPRRLFNLLCIFGNVNKIKFMKTKPGSALVEMQGYESVTRIMQVIKGIECFGSELTPKSSKQQELFERQPDESRMPNGEPFYFNFMGSRDQRFSSALDRAKNRQQTPKKTLHAYNLPKGIPEEAVMKIFEDHDGCPVPEKISFVENKYKEEAKKIGANVVFRSVPEATEALILVNHTLYTDPNERKYTVKLCYSSGRDTE